MTGVGQRAPRARPEAQFRWAQLLVGLVFLALIGRLWHLQVMSGDQFFRRSNDNFVKEIELPSSRGVILDRKGRVLAENRRLPLLPQGHELFLAMKANQEQAVDLEVNSAFDIAPQQASQLADAIGRKLKRKVRVSTTVDKSLIGGVVIRTADLVIDGSVRGRLAKLSEAMNS